MKLEEGCYWLEDDDGKPFIAAYDPEWNEWFYFGTELSDKHDDKVKVIGKVKQEPDPI